jgi:hypothetical protein
LKQINYLEHKSIDKKSWDECISRSINGMSYAYSWFLDIACPQWDALIEGEYECVMPLPNRSKFGIRYIYPPYFIQQLGVFSTEILSEERVYTFLKAIPSNYKYVQQNLNTYNKLKHDGFQVKERKTHELDLIPAYQLISSHYSENAKRNVNKGKKNSLQLNFNLRPEQVVMLFRQNKGREIETFTEKDYLVLQAIMTVARTLNQGQIWAVTDKEDNVLAGAFFVESNGKVIFLFSGVSQEGKEKGAMPFLIDSFIKFNSQRNLTLDFEGSDDPDLARFYKGFGAKECLYLQVTENRLPWPLTLFKK